MFQTAHDEPRLRRRRFGITEVLLVAGILAFGCFALVNDGRQSVGSLLAGYYETMGN